MYRKIMFTVCLCLNSLSLSLSDNPAVLYNCTVVLWKLGRQREAIKLWCKGRQLDTQTDSFQMAELIQQKKATLQYVCGSFLSLSPASPYCLVSV